MNGVTQLQYWKLFLNFVELIPQEILFTFFFAYFFFLTVISCYLLLFISHVLSQEIFPSSGIID